MAICPIYPETGFRTWAGLQAECDIGFRSLCGEAVAGISHWIKTRRCGLGQLVAPSIPHVSSSSVQLCDVHERQRQGGARSGSALRCRHCSPNTQLGALETTTSPLTHSGRVLRSQLKDSRNCSRIGGSEIHTVPSMQTLIRV
jgi:hypothetical protein